MSEKIKISCWIGNAPNHIALVSKINQKFGVDSVLIDTKSLKKKKKKSFLSKVIHKVCFRKIDLAWNRMQKAMHDAHPNLPNVETLHVPSINSKKAFKFISNNQPELVIVSGTSLIKNKMLSINPSKGILNLHTGLSPYVKGGPNCTNWCIANGTPELIGNTIMWIDLGIDTGNIVTTERTPLKENTSLDKVHLDVMNHAHSLYLDSIQAVIDGNAPNVKQSTICEGKTFYTKEWSKKKKFQLLKNLTKRNFFEARDKHTHTIKTIKLP